MRGSLSRMQQYIFNALLLVFMAAFAAVNAESAESENSSSAVTNNVLLAAFSTFVAAGFAKLVN